MARMTGEQAREAVDYLRVAWGMKNTDIANILGCGSATVGHWRKGGPIGRVLAERLLRAVEMRRSARRAALAETEYVSEKVYPCGL